MFIFEKIEEGVSLAKILDIRGYLPECEARVAL